MFTQPTLGDAARAARDAAIMQVDGNADPDWKDAARDAVLKVAHRKHQFTTDDVWEELGENLPHEKRAIGPVMLELVRTGRIVKVPNTTQVSSRPEAHMNPKQVYMRAGATIVPPSSHMGENTRLRVLLAHVKQQVGDVDVPVGLQDLWDAV